MSKRKTAEIPADRHPLHPERKLVTRRDFISVSAKATAATAFVPGIFDIVLGEREARAGECATGTTAGTGRIPFLVFDCAGGAALMGNWVPTDQAGMNGQALPSYSKMGLASQSQFIMDYRFGAPMAAPILVNPQLFSRTFTQLIDDTVLPPAVRACLRMGLICHTSLSDSGTNHLSAISLVTAAGLRGNRIGNGLGTNQSDSAGNSIASSFNPTYKPMGIQSVDSLSLALSYGPAWANLPVKLKDRLAATLVKLSESQGRSLASLRLGEQFAQLAGCGFEKNVAYTQDKGGIDPRQDPVVSAIYNITAGSNASSRDVVIATIVKNAVEGNSGGGVITIGGCDYHSGNQTDGDNKDTEIGLRIAQALRVAHAKGKPLAFQIFTDGGIYSDDLTRNWRGDSNDASLSIFGVMDPRGPRTMISKQISRYTVGQGADRNHYLGTDPNRVAHTVLLNYLALHGEVGRYASVAGDTPSRDQALDPAMLDQLLLFPNSGG